MRGLGFGVLAGGSGLGRFLRFWAEAFGRSATFENAVFLSDVEMCFGDWLVYRGYRKSSIESNVVFLVLSRCQTLGLQLPK